MNPYRKTALLLIRLIAFGCMLFGLLHVGAYMVAAKAGKGVDRPLEIALKSLPLLVGLVLMFKSYSIAKRMTEDLED